MCRPEKGERKPLHSVDFWNLSGRAGRLLREFQGNIFLIDYDRWKKQPLNEAQSAIVVPAVENAITSKDRELLRVIREPHARRLNDDNLEAVFVRLLVDLERGTLPAALARIDDGLVGTQEKFATLINALEAAAPKVTLPRAVLRQSPNISPHKQERLYAVLKRRAAVSSDAALALIPKHPWEPGAYDTYANMFGLCHRIILGLKPTSRFNRFIAVVALRWMQGQPLPRIVQSQLESKFNKGKNQQFVVRETLKLVEKEVRYQCVRLSACYIAILDHALAELRKSDLRSTIPALPLFLEIGASTRTMVALMALGLSRTAAASLSSLAPNPMLQTESAARWLRTLPIDSVRLSPLVREEVSDLIENLTITGSIH
jgi:hypothetical protein